MSDPSEDEHVNELLTRLTDLRLDELTKAFATFWVSWSDPRFQSHQARRELRELLTRLADGAPRERLVLLTKKYSVDISDVLHVLWTGRFRWVNANRFKMYEGRSLDEIESWPEALRRASEILALSGAFLGDRWFDSLLRCGRPYRDKDGNFVYGETRDRLTLSVDAKRLLEEYKRLADPTQKSALLKEYRDHAVALEVSEWLEVEQTCSLVDENIGPGSEADILNLQGLLSTARAVLDKARWSLLRLDHPNMSYPTGTLIFRSGRRREYGVQAECAHELVNYFKQRAGRPLYDHTGILMMATFPETCGSFWRNKRPHDAVRRLLTQYPL